MPYLFNKHKVSLILIALILIGAFLRFYNLNWRSPFYFHPDERNIATSIAQLSFPNQMNPNFFAYGSLPIYITYFTGILKNIIQNSQQVSHVSFENAILITRFYSAFFSTLLIPLIFFIGKKLADDKTGILASFLATFSVGFIQFAHFGTYEMWLTFFSILFFWFCLKLFNEKNKSRINAIFMVSLIFGTLIATKTSSLALLPLPLLVIFLEKRNLIQTIKQIILFVMISFIVYTITNPYVLLDSVSFINSMKYESDVATGALKVFYSGAFDNTTPVIFQFLTVYPFILNPLLTFIFIPSFFYFSYKTIITKNSSYLILTTFYLILLLSQAFLYVKWTRYMVPTLPFIYLITAIAISDVIARSIATKQSLERLPRSFQSLAMTIFILINVLFGISYFITAFARPDTRIAASEFARKNIPKNARILSEPYDLGITPFNSYYPNISIFNFYELDPESPDINLERLSAELDTSDYIILPSQRLLKSRTLNEYKFPNGYEFYKGLLSEKSGFEKIYETPCDISCKITYLGDPVYWYEETTNVFDKPTVMIFKKK